MLRRSLEDAQNKAVGIGHFNLGDGVFLKAVAAAAREVKAPVIVGASEGERSFWGTAQPHLQPRISSEYVNTFIAGDDAP